jgi:hypothetical protein
MKTSSLVRRYKAAMQRIRTPPADPLCRKPRKSRSNPTGKMASLVLQTAARLYQQGDVVSPLAISKHLACSRQNISNVIIALRHSNLWPYKGGRTGLKYDKSNALQTAPRT